MFNVNDMFNMFLLFVQSTELDGKLGLKINLLLLLLLLLLLSSLTVRKVSSSKSAVTRQVLTYLVQLCSFCACVCTIITQTVPQRLPAPSHHIHLQLLRRIGGPVVLMVSNAVVVVVIGFAVDVRGTETIQELKPGPS